MDCFVISVNDLLNNTTELSWAVSSKKDSSPFNIRCSLVFWRVAPQSAARRSSGFAARVRKHVPDDCADGRARPLRHTDQYTLRFCTHQPSTCTSAQSCVSCVGDPVAAAAQCMKPCRCRSSASSHVDADQTWGWRKSAVPGTFSVEWSLMPDGLVWVFRKIVDLLGISCATVCRFSAKCAKKKPRDVYVWSLLPV